MILVTVGTQLPFDRLVRHVDALAPELGGPVLAQIGRGGYRPVNCQYREEFAPLEFDKAFREADVIVSHAGIGTILNAQRLGKPIIILARSAAHGEHRNDHQVATCRQLMGRPGIAVAETAEDVATLLLSGSLVAASAAELTTKREQFCQNLSDALARL